jgi:hypothetical protein
LFSAERYRNQAYRRSGLVTVLVLTRLFGVTTKDSERYLDEEPDYAKEIVRHVLTMQANAAARQRRPLCRGTHAKGVCVRARFEVLDVTAGRDPVLAARLAKGIFAKPGSYPAIVRFANSDPQVNSDQKWDVRSLSFCVDLTAGGTEVPADGIRRQDFSLQSAPTLPINDARAFLATMKVLTAASPLKGLAGLTFGDQLRVIRAIGLAKVQSKPPRKAYQQLRYWSTVPFRHGAAEVVKQCATPARGNTADPLKRREPNALRSELFRHINDDSMMGSFDIGLQLLDVSSMTYAGQRRDASFWIENASVEWSERQAPFHTVAQLALLPKSLLSAQESAALYFDVTGNAMPDSTPLGSINRARWRAEAASRQARASAEMDARRG